MKALLGYSFAEFVDTAIRESDGERLLIIACNVKDPKIPANMERSSVKYLAGADKAQVLEVTEFKELLAYVCKLELEKEEIHIYIYGSMTFKMDLILSKLYKLKNVTIGEPNELYREKLLDWCSTVNTNNANVQF